MYQPSLYKIEPIGPFTERLEIEGAYPEELLRGVTYLPTPIFESQALCEEIVTAAQCAKEKDTISAEKIWLGIYFHKEIQKGWHPKIKVRWMGEPLHFGVFAGERLAACSFVGEYTGIVEEGTLDTSYAVRFPSWALAKKKISIQAARYGNFTRCINHSEDPNLILMSVYWKGLPRMILITLKTIPEGTQLTFDYGASFWKEISQTPLLI